MKANNAPPNQPYLNNTKFAACMTRTRKLVGFLVVDIVQVLTQQANYQTARKYWNKLKELRDNEGSELVTNCHQLKVIAGDGKYYFTDVATVEKN